ncbi:hypothetical protein [Chryseobacterium gleum]|uniref:hypothetical protein n=1 Tax=Chryseobacterium gleum TaxID=250 RepID=UPI002420115C|nr:hypothetical protein [Chryseobacterium gleum]
MKKTILTMLCMTLGTGLAFAGSNQPAKKIKKENKKATCTVSCSVTVTNSNGSSITYTMSAGNLFTSCGAAQQKCSTKMKATFGMEPTGYEL